MAFQRGRKHRRLYLDRFSAATLNLLRMIKLIVTMTELIIYTGLIKPNIEKRGHLSGALHFPVINYGLE